MDKVWSFLEKLGKLRARPEKRLHLRCIRRGQVAASKVNHWFGLVCLGRLGRGKELRGCCGADNP